MALDDASDPFQQVVYLQEGDAPDFRFAYCDSFLGSKYKTSQWYRSIYICDVFNENIFNRIEIPINKLKDGRNWARIAYLIAAPGGDIFALFNIERYSDYVGFKVIKVNAFSGQIEAESAFNYSSSRGGFFESCYGCFCNGHFYVADFETINKLNPTTLSIEKRVNIAYPEPINNSYNPTKERTTFFLRTDGQNIFYVKYMEERQRGSAPSTAEGYSYVALCELNPNNLQETIVQEKLEIALKNQLERIKPQGLTVENGVAYLALSGYYEGMVTSTSLENASATFQFSESVNGLASNQNGVFYFPRFPVLFEYNLNDLSVRMETISTPKAVSPFQPDATIAGNDLIVISKYGFRSDFQSVVASYDTANNVVNYVKNFVFPSDPLNGDPEVFKEAGFITAVQN